MDRHYWSRRISQLDPARDYHEIYRILAAHEFPWDMNQSLSFALYRTYAVPSIGRLLCETSEFTHRTQKRYDDTALILDAILEHGLASPDGRAAVRRMNQMHGAYNISNDDKLYVLAAFVSCRSAGSTSTAGGGSPRPSARPAPTTTANWAGTWESGTSRKLTSSSVPSWTSSNASILPSTKVAWRCQRRRCG